MSRRRQVVDFLPASPAPYRSAKFPGGIGNFCSKSRTWDVPLPVDGKQYPTAIITGRPASNAGFTVGMRSAAQLDRRPPCTGRDNDGWAARIDPEIVK